MEKYKRVKFRKFMKCPACGVYWRGEYREFSLTKNIPLDDKEAWSTCPKCSEDVYEWDNVIYLDEFELFVYKTRRAKEAKRV